MFHQHNHNSSIVECPDLWLYTLQVVPGIEEFTQTGVQFTNGTHEVFDAVIMATGYRSITPSHIKVTLRFCQFAMPHFYILSDTAGTPRLELWPLVVMMMTTCSTRMQHEAYVDVMHAQVHNLYHLISMLWVLSLNPAGLQHVQGEWVSQVSISKCMEGRERAVCCWVLKKRAARLCP